MASDGLLSRNPITGIAGCCVRAASGDAAAAPPINVMNSRRLTADASCAPDRKDSTPRHGRLLRPSSWAERDERDLAADIFSKEVTQKQATLLARQDLPQLPEIVSDQISGDGAWMNFRFSRALPPGASGSRRDERHSIRWTLPGRTT